MSYRYLVALFVAATMVVAAGCPANDDSGGGGGGNVGPVPPLPPDVVPVVEDLNQGSAQEKIQAAAKAAAMGEKAKGTAASLCANAVDSNEDVQVAALKALEKVAPELFPHVRVIVRDSSSSSRQAAVVALGEMGQKARAAWPVVKYELYRPSNVNDSLRTLGKIAPDSDAVVAMLAAHLIHTIDKERPEYEQNYQTQAAAEGLGLVAAAEPAKRTKIVAILQKHLDGYGRLGAVKALAFCGPEAADVAEQVRELRFDSDGDVVAAADATIKEIEGFTQAAAKLKALGASPAPASLAQCAADPQDKWLRQLAGERLRLIHPELERLAAALFTPPTRHYQEGDGAIDPASFGPANNEAGPFAVALVEQFVKEPQRDRKEWHADYSGPRSLAAYRALTRLCPKSPAVVAGLTKACNHHVAEYTKPHSLLSKNDLPQYWTGAELVAIAIEQPETAKMLCEAATRLTKAASFEHREFTAENSKLLNQVLANLTAVAKARPDARPEIAAAVVEVMRKRMMVTSIPSANVDHDILEQALLACEEQTYLAVAKADAAGQYGDAWGKRLLQLMRKLKPANDPLAADMSFEVGDQVWLKSGDVTFNAKVVEKLGGQYRVQTPENSTPESGSWEEPGKIVKPHWPVPKQGYQYGDLVEVEQRGRWVPGKIDGSAYGLYAARLDETDKSVRLMADQIRPRTSPIGPGGSYRAGDKVRVQRGGQLVDAVVVGPDSSGRIRVRYEQGGAGEEAVDANQIQVRVEKPRRFSK